MLAHGRIEELADFGKAHACGLCVLPGMKPIVSFPAWGEEMNPDQPVFPLAVVHGNGAIQDFDGHPREVFSNLICVQSLFCQQSLSSRVMWVLDSGHGPAGKDLKDGAAKLLKVNVHENGTGGTVDQIYTFPKSVLPKEGYLNDVRVDGHGFAYITDSNSASIIVLDLAGGVSKVWKDDRMKAWLDQGEKFEIAGKDMSFLEAHVDGIAYSPVDDMLYWKPCVRSSLFRVQAGVIRDVFQRQSGFDDVSRAVEDMGWFGFHDGLDADQDGNVYLTDVVQGAIQQRAKDGTTTLMSAPGAMHWPDAVIASEGSLFVVTTQVHLMPFLNDGKDMRPSGNKLLRVSLPYPSARL